MNDSTTLQKFQQALELIEQAKQLLCEVSATANPIRWTAKRYEHELAEFLNCDNGESGYAVFVEDFAANGILPN